MPVLFWHKIVNYTNYHNRSAIIIIVHGLQQLNMPVILASETERYKQQNWECTMKGKELEVPPPQ